MKPILILQHLSSDGPAYLAAWLARMGLRSEVCNSAAGQPFPASIRPYAALAILGGEMSANDDLPSLRQAEALFLEALDLGRPTLGHCLGGQLMARALGASVREATVPEIGWQTISVLDAPGASAWFGAPGELQVFQWHFEAFEPPAGAVVLARSAAGPQAFGLGPHLGMQFHVEVDALKLGLWAAEDGLRHRRVLGLPTVQSGPEMLAGSSLRLAAQQALADRIYARWIGQIAGP